MKIAPKVKKLLEAEDFEALHEIAGGSSDGFWYDLTDGGYFHFENVLADKKDIKRVKDAIEVIRELEDVYNEVYAEFF